MDEMDRWLDQMPGESPAPDLALRICRELRRRRRRAAGLRFAFSLLLALVGVWLSIPGLLSWQQSIALPESGLRLIQGGLQVALTGAGALLNNALDILMQAQASTAASLGGLAWLGLTALAFGALLGLSSLLQASSQEPDR